MLKRINKRKRLSHRKVLSIVIMCLSLLFLTGINFFLFPLHAPGTTSVISNGFDNKELPQGPVEEKAPVNGLTSIQEEYLHEHSLTELVCFNNLSLHKIHEAEKLQIVYYEIIVPPPKA